MKANTISQNHDKQFHKEERKINILGTEYQILYKNYNDDTEFNKEGAAGYCNMMSKKILICNLDSYPDALQLTEFEAATTYKEILRHEIIHAFLFESGLDNESYSPNNWAHSEEIVDWIAIQSPKFIKVFKELGIEE